MVKGVSENTVAKKIRAKKTGSKKPVSKISPSKKTSSKKPDEVVGWIIKDNTDSSKKELDEVLAIFDNHIESLGSDIYTQLRQKYTDVTLKTTNYRDGSSVHDIYSLHIDRWWFKISINLDKRMISREYGDIDSSHLETHGCDEKNGMHTSFWLMLVRQFEAKGFTQVKNVYN
jgi:hypothetical protein